MRLIHTADIHLDSCFAGAALPPGFSNRRRQSLRDVVRFILGRAVEWPADAVLIAGDLFDDDRVTRDTVAFLKDAFAQADPVPICIAPGNHDPFTPHSPYAEGPWPGNVHIFSRAEWDAVSLADGHLVVHGFAFDGPNPSNNPFGALQIPRDGAVHVAVAHGSEMGHQPPDQKDYAPFEAARAAAPGLAYLALGHFHRMTPIVGDFETVMYYPGSPEGLEFKHTGLHHYLEIEIVDGRVSVHPVASSRVLYAMYTIDCGDRASSQEIVDALREAARESHLPVVARAALTGSCDASLQASFPSVYDAVAGEFEYLDLVDRTHPWEDFDDLARQNTSLGAFLRRIQTELADAPDDARRQLLERAREVGLAAYRNAALPIRGIERGM